MFGSEKSDAPRRCSSEYSQDAEERSQHSSHSGHWADKITTKKGHRVLKKKNAHYPLVGETSPGEHGASSGEHDASSMTEHRVESIQERAPRIFHGIRYSVPNDLEEHDLAENDKSNKNMYHMEGKETTREEGRGYKDEQQRSDQRHPRDSGIAMLPSSEKFRGSPNPVAPRLHPERRSDDLRTEYAQHEVEYGVKSTASQVQRDPNVLVTAAPYGRRHESDAQAVPPYHQSPTRVEQDSQNLSTTMGNMHLTDNASADATDLHEYGVVDVGAASVAQQSRQLPGDRIRGSDSSNQDLDHAELDTGVAEESRDFAPRDSQYQLTGSTNRAASDKPMPAARSEISPMPGAFPMDSDSSDGGIDPAGKSRVDSSALGGVAPRFNGGVDEPNVRDEAARHRDRL
ncbi:hypothetical protein N3K66_004197 [Trichothecium roseum]|uniref:Uncharacterized protein n=1 Tax=Trichothecium roseum TaxID=47278 RepID=A0ACC0V0J7_9HYPO|nr:hypothetical protein N3K66_004197 [Trichothecium roseum]